MGIPFFMKIPISRYFFQKLSATSGVENTVSRPHFSQILEIPYSKSSFLVHQQILLNFVGDVTDRIYDVITFVSKYLYFKKDWVSHFC